MKKILKLICFILVFITFDVSASNTVKYERIDNFYYKVKVGNYYNSDIQPIIRINDKVVYCLEPEKLVDENLDYNLGDIKSLELTDEELRQIELIGYYGYGFYDHTDYKYYLATQELIWKITRPNAEISWVTSKYGSEVISVVKEIREIKEWVRNHGKIPSLAGSTLKTTINEEFKSINYTGLRMYKVKESTQHVVESNYNRLIIKTSDYVGKSEVTMEKIKRNENDSTTLYVLDNHQSLIYLNNNEEFTFNFYVLTEVGSITIQKIDKDTRKSVPQGDASFEGTTFNIYDKKSNLLSVVVTDSSGKATLPNIKLGEYYIKEVKSGRGYKHNLDSMAFILTNQKPNTIQFFENEVIKGNLEIIKTYSNGVDNIFENNASFELEDSSGNITTITTNCRGFASAILPYGTYTLRQIIGKKNNKFIEPIEFNIDKDMTLSYKLRNELMKTTLVIKKLDKVTGELIKTPAKFKIYNLRKNEYVTVNDNEVFETKNGIIELNDIPLSIYRIEEIEAPLGYIGGDSINVELNEEDIKQGKIEVNIYNELILGKVEIIKNGDDHLLNNVIFNLYAYEDIYLNGVVLYKKNDIIEEIVTKDGIALSSLLPIGKYYVKEKSTIKGYKRDDSNHVFEITSNNIVKLELVNDLIKGKIMIKKSDLNGNMLDNVIFGIYAKEDIVIDNKLCYKKDELIDTVVTQDGIALSKDMVMGTYYAKEHETINGFKLKEDIYEFTIDKEETIILDVYNEMIYGNLEIIKIGEENDLLDNVIFGIYAKEYIVINKKLYYKKDELIDKIITKNGIAFSKSIPIGTYYAKELKTIEGYIIDETNHYFEVKNEDTIIIKVYNHKEESEIYEIPDTGVKTKKVSVISELIIIFMGYVIVKYAKA